MKAHHGVMFCIAGICLACWTAISIAQPDASGKSYQKRGNDWFLVENGVEYRVNPEVISVKFQEPIRDWTGFLASAAGLSASELSQMREVETIRSNRLGIHDLQIPEGADVFDVIDSIRGTGLVEFAEENTFGHFGNTPNDPSYSQQWGLHNTGQTGGSNDADIDAPEAWDLQDGDSSVWVAILDSGTNIGHNDLNDNIWHNLGETPNNGQDDDNNGYIDDYDGWDFFNDNRFVDGPFSHGSLVGGIVAAETNNGLGVAGVAGGGFFGSSALNMICGVGDFFPDGAILDDAILYALDNGARVITMSLTVGSSSAINNALEDAWNGGVFIDCASGNGGSSVGYPANNEYVMAVAATDHNDNKASFSNPGPQVEVAAPGVDILSTALGQGYETSSGTSFAAPHVAGVAALLFSQAPGITNSFVRQALIDSADDVEAPGFDNGTGWGRINAASALALVGTTDPPIIDSLDPDCGRVNGITTVTIFGENFFGTPNVTFGGQAATFVNPIDSMTIVAGCPAGTTMDSIDVFVETPFGNDTAVDGFTYGGTISSLGTPSIGNSIQYSGNGVPNGDWGLVIDYEAGLKLKKGLLFRINFSSDFEIVHDAFRTADFPLTGGGQGNTSYTIPDDPSYIGRTLYAEGVFDGNGPGSGRELRLGKERIDLVILP